MSRFLRFMLFVWFLVWWEIAFVAWLRSYEQ